MGKFIFSIVDSLSNIIELCAGLVAILAAIIPWFHRSRAEEGNAKSKPATKKTRNARKSGKTTQKARAGTRKSRAAKPSSVGATKRKATVVAANPIAGKVLTPALGLLVALAAGWYAVQAYPYIRQWTSMNQFQVRLSIALACSLITAIGVSLSIRKLEHHSLQAFVFVLFLTPLLALAVALQSHETGMVKLEAYKLAFLPYCGLLLAGCALYVVIKFLWVFGLLLVATGMIFRNEMPAAVMILIGICFVSIHLHRFLVDRTRLALKSK